MPLPTTHRLVQELETCGMLERVGDHLRLGQSLAGLGQRARSHLQTLFDDMLPFLVRLQEDTGLDVTLSAFYDAQVIPIGQLSRQGDITVISYAPSGSAMNSVLVMAAMGRHDSDAGTVRPITRMELTGVGVAISPQGTAIRAVIALIGRSEEAVSAAVPLLHTAARWFNQRLARFLTLPPIGPVPNGCPETPSMLARGFALLNSLRAGETQVTLTELAERAGLPKSTAHRLIMLLKSYHFLQDGGTGIMFGPRVFALSAQAPCQRLLREVASPRQRALCEITGGLSFLLVPHPPVMDRLTCVCPNATVATAINRGADSLAARLSSAAAMSAIRDADPTYRFASDCEVPDEPTQPRLAALSGLGCTAAHTDGDLMALAVPILGTRGTPIRGALTLVMQNPSLTKLRQSVLAARHAAADIALSDSLS